MPSTLLSRLSLRVAVASDTDDDDPVYAELAMGGEVLSGGFGGDGEGFSVSTACGTIGVGSCLTSPPAPSQTS